MGFLNKASKYFHVLIYDIKHNSYNLLVFFLNFIVSECCMNV